MVKVLLFLTVLVHVVVKGASAEQISRSRESFIAESSNVRPVENICVANEAEYYQRIFLPALIRPIATHIQGFSDSHQRVLFAGGQGADCDCHRRVDDASGNVWGNQIGLIKKIESTAVGRLPADHWSDNHSGQMEFYWQWI